MITRRVVVGCGVAFLDYDNDGWLDIFVLSGTRLEGAPPGTTNRLYKNNRDGTFTDVTDKAGLTRSGTRHWLKVLLVGVKSNRSAIGARVTAHYGGRMQTQDVSAQSSFYSANDRRLHFGLGEATSADLTIRWPNGQVEKIAGIAANHLVVIREGSGIERREKFAGRLRG